MKVLYRLKYFLLGLLTKRPINTARRIVVGFALLILSGAILLMLPISSVKGEATPFLTALFTSTSATCVTGLSLVNAGEYLSLFGQMVLLALIQTGGLGFMMILCFVFLLSKKRIGIRNRMMIAQSVGIDSLNGIVLLAKHALSITAVVEAAGAVILSARFIPRFGILKGIWFGIFHSVSAFCNAGFDLIGDGKSMISYRNDPIMLITLAALIIIGGLGFIVWEEIIKKRSFKKLSVYSKITIIVSAALIVLGAIVFLLLEHVNAETIGSYTPLQKILASFFQSVTTRTAGFDAIGQSKLTEPAKLWSIILMMIGGASGSTAGGIKVGTAAIVLLSLWSVLRARPETVIFGRRITYPAIIHAMTLMTLWLLLTAAGAAAIAVSDRVSLINSLYEIASAYSTVGLSVGITETASDFTKILFIIYMFFGRVGIMTISVMFMTRSGRTDSIRYPDGDFFIG